MLNIGYSGIQVANVHNIIYGLNRTLDLSLYCHLTYVCCVYIYVSQMLQSYQKYRCQFLCVPSYIVYHNHPFAHR